MSDFINSFWSYYVVVIVVVSFVGMAALLMTSSRVRGNAGKQPTTGHIWDESLQEMNNPLPRWWKGLFIITLIFGVVYLILYPGLGSYAGVLGWSSAGSYDDQNNALKAKIEPMYKKFAGMPIEQLAGDKEAMGIGQRIFLNNCAQCHGSDAKGTKEFPDLTGAYGWRWGDSPQKIEETITQGRTGIMPPQGAAMGTPADVENVANYVLSLSKGPHDAAKAALGEAKFKTTCAACHGPDGKGNQLLGSQDLTKKIWQRGWGLNAIIHQINTGRTGQMPTWGGKLTPEQIHVVAAFVWGLSHKPGEAPAASASPAAAAPVAQ
ncbi:MAG: cytochrome-c oxidase, cbb3-type subunit III [Burkholderiaceae bacterium]|jgi:cytochrome c oxidase cbb3-type subunit 3|nr:cytochrome-c oxidase, cbb3-type subunit III [Burkholderiaceae bacterium]